MVTTQQMKSRFRILLVLTCLLFGAGALFALGEDPQRNKIAVVSVLFYTSALGLYHFIGFARYGLICLLAYAWGLTISDRFTDDSSIKIQELFSWIFNGTHFLHWALFGILVALFIPPVNRVFSKDYKNEI